MKKLTVMVSVYNAGDFIENRLNNLFNCDMINDIDIWVLNANSPDERDHTIPHKRRHRLNYLKLPERVNVYSAWNYIIQNSNSKYITNANADDLVSPDCYNRLTEILDRTSKFNFVYPSWYTTSTTNLKWEHLNNDVAIADGMPGIYNGDLGNGGVGHFPMWRRSLHPNLGYFDEEFKALGDADWWARCFYVGKSQFKWLNNFLACYLWRNGQNLWHKEINDNEWGRYHQKVARYKLGML